MDKTDRLRDYGLAFLLYEQGLGICGYELIRELFIFVKLILNSYLLFSLLYSFVIPRDIFFQNPSWSTTEQRTFLYLFCHLTDYCLRRNNTILGDIRPFQNQASHTNPNMPPRMMSCALLIRSPFRSKSEWLSDVLISHELEIMQSSPILILVPSKAANKQPGPK